MLHYSPPSKTTVRNAGPWPQKEERMLSRFHYSITLPDHSGWHQDTGYSPLMADILTQAFTLIRRSSHDAAGFARALAVIRPFLDAPMCRHQRLRVFYLVALARSAIGHQDAALFWLDEMLNLADQVRDTSDLADAYHLRGGINRALSRLRDASADYRTCLALLDDQAERNPLAPAQATNAVKVRAELAGFEFFLGHYELAQHLTHEARLLLHHDISHTIEEATISWIQSLLDRWAGRPEQALEHARLAADVFTELGSPASAARIQTVLADTILDIAERIPTGSERERVLKRSWPHIQLALSLAKEAQDQPGLGPARLARLRYLRLRGADQPRLPTIEHIARLGERLADEGLIAYAFTAMGDELLASGDRNGARAHYRDALGVLDGSDVSAVGKWALRALRLIEEMWDEV